MDFRLKLKQLGLPEKEASVYLASLELGPSPVQPISRRAQVARATTYVVLEALIRRGLITQYKEGKKTLFAAESPNHLLQFVEREEDAVREKREELETLLPELQAFMKSVDDRPVVRYYDGLEGLRTMRREMVMQSSVGDAWYNFTPLDHLVAVFGRNDASYLRQRVAKGISAKVIFTTHSEETKQLYILEGRKYGKLWEAKFIEPDQFQSTSGMTIYRDKIAMGTFSGKVGGVVIESKSMVQMAREQFLILWNSLDSR